MSNEKTILIIKNGGKRVLKTGELLTRKSIRNAYQDVWEITRIIIGTNISAIANNALILDGDVKSKPSILSSVFIPNTVKSIGAGAFHSNKKLTSIIIPDSVTRIGTSAFFNCIKLESVILSNNINNIQSKLFVNCKSLKKIVIPDNVEKISNFNVFIGSGIETFYVSKSNKLNIKEEGDYVIKSTSQNENITVQVKFIEPTLLYTNSSIEPIRKLIEGKLTAELADMYKSNNVTDIDIGDGVTDIEIGVFSSYKNLSSITIPNSVTKIDSEAFSSSKIEKLYINKKNNILNIKEGKQVVGGKELEVITNELKINHDGPIYFTQGQNIKDFNDMNNFTFTLESETSAKLIDNADVDYEIDSSKINFGNVGTYIITINAKYDGLKATRNRQVYVITKKNPGIILNKDIIGVKKNQRFNPTIIVKDPDHKLQSSDYKTTFTKIDTSNIDFTYSTLTAIDKFGNKSEKRMDVIISDRRPKIEFVGNDILRIKRNTPLNPEITVTDPDGIVPQKDIKVVYYGIDTRYSGSYTITIEATDPYGNSSTKERKVIVMEDGNNVSLQSITPNINPQSQENNSIEINSVNMTGGTFLIDYFPLINNDFSVYDIRQEESFYDTQINLYKENDIINTLENSPDEIFTKNLGNMLGIKYRFSKSSDDTYNFSQKFFDSNSSEIYESTNIIKYIQYLFIKDINHNISDEKTEDLIYEVKSLAVSESNAYFSKIQKVRINTLNNNFYNIPVAQLDFKELNNISNTTNFNVEKTNEKEILFSLKKIPDIMPWLNNKTYAQEYSTNVKDTYFCYGFSFDVSEYNIKISELTSFIENNGNKNVFNIKTRSDIDPIGNRLLLNYYLNNNLENKSGVFYGFDNMSVFDISLKKPKDYLYDYIGFFDEANREKLREFETLNTYLDIAKKGLKDTSQTLYTYMELIKSFLEARYLANFMYLNTYKNGKIEKIKLADLVAEGDGYKDVELDKEYPLSQIFNPKRNMGTTKYTANFKSVVYKFATFDPNYKSNLEKLEKLGLTKKSKVVKQTRQETSDAPLNANPQATASEDKGKELDPGVIAAAVAAAAALIAAGDDDSASPPAPTPAPTPAPPPTNVLLSVPNENAEASMVNQKKPKAGNSALGVEALKNSTTSILNSAIGYQALLNTNSSNNTAMGTKVGPTLKSGKKNVLLGNETDVSSENAINQVVIGTKAKGVANHTMVFGGTMKKSDTKYDSKVTALDSLDPGVTNHTDLGSTAYKFSSLYVSTLNNGIDNGIDFTLPTSHPKDNGYLLQRNEDGNLEWSKPTLNKIIIKSGSKHTVTSSSNIASISITHILEGNGRLLVDANTTSIVFTSTGAVMIKNLGLKHDGDYISNSFIAKIGSSMVVSGGEITATDSSNVTISKDDIYADGIKTNMSTVLMFIRKSSTSLEIKFDGHMN